MENNNLEVSDFAKELDCTFEMVSIEDIILY